MYDLAFHALQSGWPVILDAVFAGPEERRRAEETAMGVYPFHGLWMDAPREVLLGRVRARTDDASDADARVVEQQLGYDLGRIGWHRLDATKATPELLADAGRAIGQN
jgi:predicted kinase